MNRYQLALVLLLPAHAMAAEVGFSVAPFNSSIAPLDTVSIDLVGNYVGAGNLVGGAVNLSFDKDILEVLSITPVAPHDFGWQSGAIDNALGTVTGIGFASFMGVSGSFTLATVEFRGVGPGTSLVNVTDANDPIYVWSYDVAPYVPVTFVDGSGSITVAVPEPETWAMLLAGLGLVGFVARRRHG
jgi:hypothetical protein